MTSSHAPTHPAQPDTTFRLASYAVCRHDDEILLVSVADPGDGNTIWTLPGGGVEPLEDPFETVTREVAEETGVASRVVRLLGVDSRVIPQHEAMRGVPHHNVGIFYEVAVHPGELRDEPSEDTAAPTWVPCSEVAALPRSGLVDIGITLFAERPASGHVPSVGVEGLVRH
ncbi:NUDIX hydrolase [Corynebacterium glyciniphilum]|uniref:NUDIX hydrolase n=1 Tax=Corynebacterium glyciniphilum TaxID=1404244 RepID=UPI0011AB4475|nr:NUDIX domain-containing protein [Corynebacterium glyciniphilum]